MFLFKQRSDSVEKHFVITHFEPFLDGGLTKTEIRFYEQHLANCQQCQDWVERQESLIERLRIEAGPTCTLSPAAANRIDRNLYSKMRRAIIMNNLRASLGAVVAIAILAIFVGVFFWWQSSNVDATIQTNNLQEEFASPVDQVSQEQEIPEQEELSSTEQEVSEFAGMSKVELDELLIEAVRAEDSAKAERLLEAGADANAISVRGNSILGMAVAKGNVELVRSLITHGASVKSMEEGALLPIATQLGHLEVVKVLLDAGVDVDSTWTVPGEFENSAALQWAAIGNHVEILELLLEHGAEVNQVETLHNLTPLHGAAYYNSPEAMEILLANGADPDIQDSNGETSLHYAVNGEAIECIRLLVEHGAALDIRSDQGNTPLDKSYSAEIDQILIEAGAGQ